MFGQTNEMSLEITAYSGVGPAAFGDLLRFRKLHHERYVSGL